MTTFESWIANVEERRGAHIDIDRTEVEEYYFTALTDYWDFEPDLEAIEGAAFDATLGYFEDQGLTEELLEDILDDGRG